MFWDASYTPSPKIEALLSQENVTLSELLDDEEIISECKSQNNKLVQFLNRPDTLEELVTLITTVPPADVGEALRFKHSNIACEILTSDLQSINRSIVCEEKVLLKLYAFLEQEAPLNPLLLSFFSKVFGMLWTQKQKQDWFTYQFVCVTLLEFLKGRGNFLDNVLRHIYSPVMLDLVYHMVTQIEGPDIRKTLYEWLMEQRLVEKLIKTLGEAQGEDAAEKHLNVAQFIVEYLAMGRTKRQSEKQEGATADPILELLEDKSTIELLLQMITGEAGQESPSAIVAGTRIILALFDDNLINDNTDDPALQYLVNAEKEHHATVVANLIDVLKGYVSNFHALLLVDPPPIVVADEAPVVDSAPNAASSPERVVAEALADDSKDSGKASDSDKVEEEDALEKVGGGEEKVHGDSSGEITSSSGAPSPDAELPVEEGDKGAPRVEEAVVSTRRNNNFSQGKAFGNTRLQICGVFTVLMETENRDILTAICASGLFRTLLNLFKQYCWNNFLHTQVRKCLAYAIGAFDEVRDESTGTVQLEVSDLQRHLVVDCGLAPFLVDCWYANEREEVENNGVRLGYMGHLIGILEVLATNCRVSEKLRALVEESLAADDKARWTKLIEDGGTLDQELGHQNRFLADCNPARMHECEPKDFFIEATDTFQDLENTALNENLDNFLSRYISSDLNSNFFNSINGWAGDNLDEFEDLADKNWSKFDGDDDEAEGTSGHVLDLLRPWSDSDDLSSPERGEGSAAFASEEAPIQDSGWANFSSANFADFDTHFNEFREQAIDVDSKAEGDSQSAGTGPKEGAKDCDAITKNSPDGNVIITDGQEVKRASDIVADDRSQSDSKAAETVPEESQSNSAETTAEEVSDKLASFSIGESEAGSEERSPQSVDGSDS